MGSVVFAVYLLKNLDGTVAFRSHETSHPSSSRLILLRRWGRNKLAENIVRSNRLAFAPNNNQGSIKAFSGEFIRKRKFGSRICSHGENFHLGDESNTNGQSSPNENRNKARNQKKKADDYGTQTTSSSSPKRNPKSRDSNSVLSTLSVSSSSSLSINQETSENVMKSSLSLSGSDSTTKKNQKKTPSRQLKSVNSESRLKKSKNENLLKRKSSSKQIKGKSGSIKDQEEKSGPLSSVEKRSG